MEARVIKVNPKARVKAKASKEAATVVEAGGTQLTGARQIIRVKEKEKEITAGKAKAKEAYGRQIGETKIGNLTRVCCWDSRQTKSPKMRLVP